MTLSGGMQEQGYGEGKNYVLEIRARGMKTDQLSDLAADLVGLKVDIILTLGVPSTPRGQGKDQHDSDCHAYGFRSGKEGNCC